MPAMSTLHYLFFDSQKREGGGTEEGKKEERREEIEREKLKSIFS